MFLLYFDQINQLWKIFEKSLIRYKNSSWYYNYIILLTFKIINKVNLGITML